MSLVSQVSSLATRIGTEFKTVYSRIGTLGSLTTTEKTNLVGAINEVKAGQSAAGAQIDDTTPSTTKVYSSSKTNSQISTAVNNLVGGAPGTLDTLKEIADQLASDESAVGALTTTVGTKMAKSANLSDVADVPTARGNLGVPSTTDIGDVTTNFVSVFEAALA